MILILTLRRKEAYDIIRENLLILTSPPPSVFGSSEYSLCFIMNQIISYMIVIKIPSTSSLNLYFVIRSVLNIIKSALTQIVRLKKSGLRYITRIVMLVYNQSKYQVSINHGTELYPALYANVLATTSILASIFFSCFSTASILACISGGKSHLVSFSYLCSSASFIRSSARDLAYYWS